MLNSDILQHVEWLSAERRHTTYDDAATAEALRNGWIVQCPGIMRDPRMLRVALTDAGREAFTSLRVQPYRITSRG